MRSKQSYTLQIWPTHQLSEQMQLYVQHAEEKSIGMCTCVHTAHHSLPHCILEALIASASTEP